MVPRKKRHKIFPGEKTYPQNCDKMRSVLSVDSFKHSSAGHDFIGLEVSTGLNNNDYFNLISLIIFRNRRENDGEQKIQRRPNMGAWNNTNLGNDTAMDWIEGLQRQKDLSGIRDTLEYQIHNVSHFFEDFAREALAAAEILAALVGRPCQDIPDEAEKFIRRMKGASVKSSLIKTAVTAINVILEKDLLRDCHRSEQDHREWRDVTEHLKERLGAYLKTSAVKQEGGRS